MLNNMPPLLRVMRSVCSRGSRPATPEPEGGGAHHGRTLWRARCLNQPSCRSSSSSSSRAPGRHSGQKDLRLPHELLRSRCVTSQQLMPTLVRRRPLKSKAGRSPGLGQATSHNGTPDSCSTNTHAQSMPPPPCPAAVLRVCACARVPCLDGAQAADHSLKNGWDGVAAARALIEKMLGRVCCEYRLPAPGLGEAGSRV